MRRFCAVSAVVLAVLAVPSAARAQAGAHLGAFGGFTFGNTTTATTFGGSVAAPLGDHMQVVFEGGRLDDVMPSLLGTVIDFTPVDLRLSAWYGEAGIRFLPSRSAATPYIEATAGFARMKSVFAGAGSADPFVNTALRFFDRTEPMLGLGGGVVLRGGPLTLDLGYRFKRIMASDSLHALLSGGDGIDVSQARVGIGIRF